MRRISIPIALLLLVAALATSPVVARASTCSSGPVLQGVDVSVFQGQIDWPQVAQTRAFGYARISDGTEYLDPTFQANFTGMKAAGMKAGGYIFFRPGQDPHAQAQVVINALAQAGFGRGDLVPALDVEVADGQSPAAVVAAIRSISADIQAAYGAPPVISTSPGLWTSLAGAATSLGDQPLWVLNWGVTCPTLPAGWSSWSVWQYADSGRVPGIEGAVDLDQASPDLLPTYPPPVSVALACAPNPQLPGRSSTCTATVTQADGRVPTGYVRFGTPLPIDRDAPAPCLLDGAGACSVQVTAVSGPRPDGFLGGVPLMAYFYRYSNFPFQGGTILTTLMALPDLLVTAKGHGLSGPAPGVLGNDWPLYRAVAAKSARLVAPPAHGDLVLHADGSYSYSPHPGWVGVDAFSYSAVSTINGLVSDPVSDSIYVLGQHFQCPGCTLPSGLDASGYDLTNSDLTGAHLGGVTLAGSKLVHLLASRADFAGVNLVGADLSSANLRGASHLTPSALAGVIWSDTICPDGTNSDQDGGTCIGNLLPFITSIWPGSGGPGTAVSITGFGLETARAVIFGGGASAPAQMTTTVNKDGTTSVALSTTVPAAAATGPLSVVTAHGTAVSDAPFVVPPVPVIAGFTPTSGGPGTTVTISGRYLTGATRAWFGNAAYGAVTVSADGTTATTTVPVGAGTGPIRLEIPVDVNGAFTNLWTAAPFTVLGPPPSISAISPTSGPVGTIVMITGSNLGSITAIAFAGGVSASGYIGMDGNYRVVVPAGAQTGVLTALSPSGNATSTQVFTVT